MDPVVLFLLGIVGLGFYMANARQVYNKALREKLRQQKRERHAMIEKEYKKLMTEVKIRHLIGK